MKKQTLFVLTALQLAITASAVSAKATIFLDSQGKDPRQKMTSSEMPWSAIGYITAENPGQSDYMGCTGTLIGKRLVLTAAHCVVDTDNPNNLSLYKKVIFQPNYKNGKALDSSRVIDITVGAMDTLANSGNDWAILVLDKDLGTKYGFMEVESTAELELPMTVETAGYGESSNGGIVASCQIRDRYDNISNGADSTVVYNHDCSGKEGDSGSPLFHLENGKYTIAAIFTEGGVDANGNTIVTQTYDFESANSGVMNEALLQAVQAAKLKHE